MIKKYFRQYIIVFTVLTLNSCNSSDTNTGDSKEQQAKGITNYNIVIVPDLSNRVDMNIHPKPIEDKVIIQSTLGLINDILHAGPRETEQRDAYSVSFINQGVIRMYDINQSHLSIDFAKFPSQSQRIDFIKGRKDFKENGLESAVNNFQNECERFYGKATLKTDGADLWSFFQSGIDESHVKRDDKPFPYNGQLFQNQYRNILVLLTDGYIECGLSPNASQGASKNQAYDLGQSRIKAFRRAYKASGSNNMKEFFIQNGYGIVPANNKHLEDLEVIVLEMYDRSLSESGNATVHPTDAEIMELFWTDWLTKSGVERFELNRCFSNERIAKLTLKRFLLGNK